MSVPIEHAVSEDAPLKKIWGITAELRFQRLLADVMKRSGKTRAQIAAQLSQVLGCSPERPIRKQMLDDCVRSRKKGRAVRFPAAWIPGLCHILGSDELQRHLLSDRLRELLLVGENVTEAASSLKRAQQAVAKIVEQERQKAKAAKRC